MKEFVIGKNDAGQRLDRFVGKTVPLLPDSLLQKYIRLKRIKLNGKGSKRDTRLSEGDCVQLYINDEFFEKPREENSYLKVGKPRVTIVYEDENILLADKKPGVLCHSAGQWDYNTLIANIQAYLAQKASGIPVRKMPSLLLSATVLTAIPEGSSSLPKMRKLSESSTKKSSFVKLKNTISAPFTGDRILLPVLWKTTSLKMPSKIVFM